MAKSKLDRSSGFTLLELITSISIVAILVAIALPSFANMIQKTHITVASSELSTTLTLSRNYAVTTGTTVIVCHAKDKSRSQCSEKRDRNTNWANGIISYADMNNDNTLGKEDRILTVQINHSSVTTVFNQNGRLRFFADGSARSAGFYICSKAGPQGRHIRILHTGRTRTSAEMGEKQRNTCLSKAA